MNITIANHSLAITYKKQAENKVTLIFLHDAWGCSEMWGQFPAILASKLQADYVVYDRAGHGNSSPAMIERRPTSFFEDEADILIQLMDILKIKKAVLLGHSDGSTIALVAAGKYPDRIQSLILESAHTCIEEKSIQLVADITEKSKHTHLAERLEKFHGQNMPQVFRLWSYMWSDKRFAQWNIIADIKKITCPIISYRGQDDPFDSIKQNSVIAENVQSSVVISLIPNAGHAPHKDNPDAVLAFILNNKENILL